MGISAKTRRAPLRITTGAFILNSGLGKFGADDETAKYLHESAKRLSPQFERVSPQVFAKTLAVGEVALGTALLVPVVPPLAAGVGLTAFAGSLLTMWWRTPGMHHEGSIRPTHAGIPVAKDVWMLGAGSSLVLDALSTPAHDKRVELTAMVQEKAAAKKRGLRRARRKAAVGEKVSVAGDRLQEGFHEAGAYLADLRDEYQPVAAETLKKASQKAQQSAHDAGDYFADLRDEYQPVAEKKIKKAKKKARKKSKELAKSIR